MMNRPRRIVPANLRTMKPSTLTPQMAAPTSITVPARRGVYWILAVVGTVLLVVLYRYLHRMDTVPAIILGLFGGAFAFGGIKQTVSPTPFAAITTTGVAFPLGRVKEIAWSRIIDMQLGPTSITRGSETTVMWQPMLILRLKAKPGDPPPSSWAANPNVVMHSDGTVEQMIDMSLSTVLTADFIGMMAPFMRTLPHRSSVESASPAVAASTRSPDATNAFAAAKTSKPRLAVAVVTAAVAAAVFIGAGLWFSYQSYRAHSWPTAPGVVVSSAISTSTVNDTVTYHPQIVYRYTVGGREYVGARFAFSYASDVSRAQAAVARHPAGSAVKVFYEPEDPKSAIIEQSSNLFPLVFVGFGAIAALLGVAAWRARMSGN